VLKLPVPALDVASIALRKPASQPQPGDIAHRRTVPVRLRERASRAGVN
jgi:hypothetical protein